MKRSGLSLLLAAAVLVLSAACDKEDMPAVKSSARLSAPVVDPVQGSCGIITQGASGTAFTATLSFESATEPWCSFGESGSVTTAVGKVGQSLTLYVSANPSDTYRTADISVVYADGYTASLSLAQMPGTVPDDIARAWGELPAYRKGDTFIYKKYHTPLSGTG